MSMDEDTKRKIQSEIKNGTKKIIEEMQTKFEVVAQEPPQNHDTNVEMNIQVPLDE